MFVLKFKQRHKPFIFLDLDEDRHNEQLVTTLPGAQAFGTDQQKKIRFGNTVPYKSKITVIF